MSVRLDYLNKNETRNEEWRTKVNGCLDVRFHSDYGLEDAFLLLLALYIYNLIPENIPIELQQKHAIEWCRHAHFKWISNTLQLPGAKIKIEAMKLNSIQQITHD